MAQRRLTASGEALPLARPFRISRGVKTAADVVTVSISEGGVTGRGEGVPYPRYGESVGSALAQIAEVEAAIESGAGREELLDAMPAGAARNALDCALWDLGLRLAGRTVESVAGLGRADRIVTAMTVGLDQPERMAEAAGLLANAPLLKVKVDANDPGAQLRAVRRAAPQPKMIVDPNESWTMAEVEGLQDLLAELRVDLLEQPLAAGQDEGLRGYRSQIAIAADESLHTADDLAALPDGYTVGNIKLDKTGGLTGALQLAAALEARGIGLMIGCMISSSLSIVPAMALAPRCRFVDLDGPLWLSNDRDGGVTGENGYIYPARPGFWGG
ncbi:N-acetyl-D-Glu racemase DgcA [Qipengyuania oceanensis]|uniref:Dipeptide epimerase n=1 Tax=Qipengyuania oceanensis TaxID=1463597 RepID=A0A844YDL5_9SPHN|nr:N-acetyl-D-Glu racemase DgcA [Qipengyuania oceanensis]MXO61449.1 dipeptide epimerase [Qipengyuania oceanensis]